MDRNKIVKRPALTFKEYCDLIEELLKLTGRKTKPRPLMKAESFKL